jgi:hypothetical protein
MKVCIKVERIDFDPLNNILAPPLHIFQLTILRTLKKVKLTPGFSILIKQIAMFGEQFFPPFGLLDKPGAEMTMLVNIGHGQRLIDIFEIPTQ